MIRQILQSPAFKKYFQNISWLIFEKVFTLFVAMVVSIYVARYLNPANFGLLNYAISFVGIFSSFVALGLDQILVRELAKGVKPKEELLGTAFGLKVGGFFILMVIMLVIMPIMHDDALTNSLIVIIAAAEIFKAMEVVNGYFQSQVKSKFVVQIQLLINLVLSLVRILLVYIEAPLSWFAWMVFLNGLFNATGFLLVYARKVDSPFKWKFRKSVAGSLLTESWPLALYGLALFVQAKIDQVMLGKMLNNEEVGQYSVAMKFIEMFGFIPVALSSTFAPAVTQGKMHSEELYHERLINFYRLMFVAFLVVAVPIYIMAEPIIVLLYGVEYQPAGILLSLFAIRLFFSNMGVAKSLFIINESLFRYSLVTVVVGAFVNISVNYLLIPVMASRGAIVATIISFTVSIFLIDLFLKKTRDNQKLMFAGIFSFWKIIDFIKDYGKDKTST